MRYQTHIKQQHLDSYARALNQRARQLDRPGNLTGDDLRAVILECDGQCEWCGQSIIDREFEIDHIISLSRGGTHTPDNLAIACPDCNRRKHAMHPAKFVSGLIAKSGIVTDLAAHVLNYYNMTPAVQQSLFDDDTPTLPDETITRQKHDDDPPPYIWNTQQQTD